MGKIDDDDASHRPVDPLGLGGVSDEDAPSREPRPKLLSLLIEFLRMSRTTAILLVVFLLVAVLYLLVKDEPVVNFQPRPPAPSEPAEPTGSDTETTEPETGTAESDTESSEPETEEPGAASTDPDTGTTESRVATSVDAPAGASGEVSASESRPRSSQEQSSQAGSSPATSVEAPR